MMALTLLNCIHTALLPLRRCSVSLHDYAEVSRDEAARLPGTHGCTPVVVVFSVHCFKNVKE